MGLLRRAHLVVLAGALLGPVASAQSPEAAAPPAPADTTAPPLQLDGSRLRPRGSLYDVLVTSDSGTRHVGWHTVWVFDASFSGRPAWEVLERRESHPPFAVLVTQDSSVLTRDTLVPLRWEAVTGSARLVAAFANDSVYGGATAPQARSTFTVGLPGYAVTSEGALDAVLQAAPLAEGWRAGVPMLVADLSGARTVPLTLEVVSRDTVEVPAGAFQAWQVRITGGGAERLVWVDTGSQLVVKTEESPPHMVGRRVQRLLVGGY